MADGAWQTVLAAEDFVGRSAFTRRFDKLPMATPEGGDPREVLRALGFTVGEPVEDPRGRPLFMAVVPPEGWRLRPQGDDYYIDVFDASGVVRATVFHKPAHYDRRAHIAVHPRFDIEARNGDFGTDWVVVDREAGERAFAADRVHPCPEGDDAAAFDAWAECYTAARKSCRDWLAANRPDRDPTAYWSDAAASATSP